MHLSEILNQLRAKREKALVLFVTAGDPPLDQLPAILGALQEGGADVIELGLPFSDPIADGPTIQASSQRALDRGVSPRAAIQMVKEWTGRTPLLAMGYLNPVLRQGYDEFARQCVEAGITAALISDLTPEESKDWQIAAKRHNLQTVFLVAPTSTDERIKIACDASTGFVYAVSRTGVTGADNEVPDIQELIARIRQFTDLPIFVGFGVSRPDQVREICRTADGAIVGSSLVKLLAEKWNGGRGRAEIVAFVRELKSATL